VVREGYDGCFTTEHLQADRTGQNVVGKTLTHTDLTHRAIQHVQQSIVPKVLTHTSDVVKMPTHRDQNYTVPEPVTVEWEGWREEKREKEMGGGMRKKEWLSQGPHSSQ
jgi:hypothetical protein